jgi:hypothetical protein
MQIEVVPARVFRVIDLPHCSSLVSQQLMSKVYANKTFVMLEIELGEFDRELGKSFVSINF